MAIFSNVIAFLSVIVGGFLNDKYSSKSFSTSSCGISFDPENERLINVLYSEWYLSVALYA